MGSTKMSQFGLRSSEDLGECRNTCLTAFESRANTADVLLSVAEDLAIVAANKTTNAKDSIKTAQLFSTLARRVSHDLNGFHDPYKKHVFVSTLVK